MIIPLTKRQKEILDFIGYFIDKNGYAPTIKEMQKKIHLSSASTIHQHIQALTSKGYLKKIANLARAIRLVNINKK